MPGVNLKRNRARLGGRGVELKCGFATGVAANTNMTITGIKVGDDIVAAFQLAPPTDAGNAAIIANRTATTKATAADTIQCTAATNSPANSQVMVFFLSR